MFVCVPNKLLIRHVVRHVRLHWLVLEGGRCYYSIVLGDLYNVHIPRGRG